jgi:hypothetical protein
MPDDTPAVNPPAEGDPIPLIPSNFERLAFYHAWRGTWTRIVAGKFSDHPFDGLMFYEQSSGYAEFYATDGWGNISYLGSYDGWSHRWTHIVAGRFNDSPYSSLLLYDQAAGGGRPAASFVSPPTLHRYQRVSGLSDPGSSPARPTRSAE